jgi:hypothetical protein
MDRNIEDILKELPMKERSDENIKYSYDKIK